MKKRFDVNTPDDLARLLKDRKEKAKRRIMNKDKISTGNVSVQHLELANMVVKVINVLNVSPLVKKVVSKRIMSPALYGKELSHLSIALELGMREHEVRMLEKEGVEALSIHLSRVSSREFIDKFNRDKHLNKMVNESLGKSFEKDVQKGEADV